MRKSNTNGNLTKLNEIAKEIVLTKNQYDILVNSSDDWCYPYRHYEKNTGLDRATLQKEMKQLRDMGLMEYMRGLMTEEGELAGSGFCIPYGKWAEVLKLTTAFEERSKQAPSIPTETLASIQKQERVRLQETIAYYRSLQDKSDAEKAGGFPSTEAHEYYKQGMDAVIAIIGELSTYQEEKE